MPYMYFQKTNPKENEIFKWLSSTYSNKAVIKCNLTRPAATDLLPSNALATSYLTTVAARRQVVA